MPDPKPKEERGKEQKPETLSVEEIDAVEKRREHPDDFSAPGWEWAVSMCGGRDRIYGPDTPVSIGSYVAVVPRQRAERAEAERDEAQALLGELLAAGNAMLARVSISSDAEVLKDFYAALARAKQSLGEKQ